MGQIAYENLDEQLQQKINSGGSNISLPISANDVTPTPEKTFVTPSQKSAIDSHDMEIQSQTARIAIVENTLSTLSTTDEKVKMDVNGVASYLSELIDGLTVVNNNGKLEVPTLKNLLVTIQELNYLQGATSNIQGQINALSNIGNYSTTVMTYSDLALILNPQPQDMVIVLSDINHMDNSTIYIYNGTDWIYSGDFKGGEVRDFTTNPIDLSTETTGLLQKAKYEKQNAIETAFTDVSGNLVATNSQDAIVEVFRFADSLLKGLTQTVGSPLSSQDSIDVNLRNFKNWYANVAEAITLKGVNSSASNNGDELIQKIKAIPNVSIEGTIKKKSKLNVNAGSNIEVQLSSAISLTDITSTLIEFVAGAIGIVAYNLAFNNGDESNFESNEYIEFDGRMKLKNAYEKTTTKNEEWTESGGIFEFNVNISEWSSINDITINTQRGV